MDRPRHPKVVRTWKVERTKVRTGVEVIVEQDHCTVAVIRTPAPQGSLLSESIALAEARRTTAIPDEGFMKDVEEGTAERSQPWNPPTWG